MKSSQKIEWKYVYYGIFLIPFVINPFGVNPYEIPKHSWMVLFIGLFIVIAAVAWFKGKISFAYNKKVALIVALWLLSFAMSNALSVSPVESFWGSFERMQGTLTMIYYIIHFWICLQLFRETKEQSKLMHLIMIIGCIVSIHAILQWLRIDPLQLGDIDEASGRSYSTIGQPSLFGQWLIVPFFIGLIYCIETKKERIWKIMYGLSTVIAGFGLLLSLNRASMLAIAISIILYGVYKFRKSIPKAAIVMGGILVTVMMIAVLFGGSSRSLHSRIELWENSLPLVMQGPIFGSGLETYYQTYQTVATKEMYLTETLYDIADRTHNETVQVLLDQGLSGLVLYIFNLLFLGWIYVKNKAKTKESKMALFALIAILISVQFSFSTTPHMIVIMSLWAILIHGALKMKEMSLNVTIPLRLGGVLVAIFLGIFSITHASSITRANALLGEAIGQFFKDYNKTSETFGELLEIAPNYRHLHFSAIHFLASKEKLEAHPEHEGTLKKYGEELKIITNESFRYHLSAAKISLALDDYVSATSHYERAAQKAPNLAVLYQEWGLAAFDNEDYGIAIEKLEKLQELAPYFWKAPTDDSDPDHAEKHRIFKKTHGLFYYAMGKLAFSYRMESKAGDNNTTMTKEYSDKAKELEKELLKGVSGSE